MTQVGQAVDVLLDGSKGVACWALLMFYLAVVLEGGDVVGGGLDAQDEAKFVVDLDRGFAEPMLDAGAPDAGGEPTADLLGELGVILWPRKVATCSALTVRMACRESCS